MNVYWAQEVPAVEAPAIKRSERLHRLARCVDLLAEELDALELGDLPRMRDLAEKRAALEAEIAPAPAADQDDDDAVEGSPFHVVYMQAVTEALQRVDEWTERERSTRDELTHLRDESLTRVRSIPQRTAGGKYPVLEEMGGQLNVRL
jgi:hypothetical protein